MTLLPNKHVPTGRSFVGTGAILLSHLIKPMPVSALWELTRAYEEISHFGSFVLTLDYLYSIGAVQFDNGIVSRSRP